MNLKHESRIITLAFLFILKFKPCRFIIKFIINATFNTKPIEIEYNPQSMFVKHGFVFIKSSPFENILKFKVLMKHLFWIETKTKTKKKKKLKMMASFNAQFVKCVVIILKR